MVQTDHLMSEFWKYVPDLLSPATVPLTHNANVVVGADAEEVIIANQHGKESPNREKRFEYRTGAIENTTPVLDDHGECLPGVLNQKGIQEQIRDILEGGRDAFELRRKKYIRN